MTLYREENAVKMFSKKKCQYKFLLERIYADVRTYAE